MERKANEATPHNPLLVNNQHMIHEDANTLTVIGIGASAGGLEALQDFLDHFPTDVHNVSIIIAQHLSPRHKSMLVHLLSKGTKLQVKEAQNGEKLSPNVVYITPPDTEISLESHLIQLHKPFNALGPKPSVDVLFASMAEETQYAIIGVILSGTGTDGAEGIKAIRNAGGLTVAQEPNTAKYNGMPQAAIDTGLVDLVLPPSKIGEEIKEFVHHPETYALKVSELDSAKPSLEKIFQLLSKRTGTDFSNYKPATIGRRFNKRIASLGIQTIDEYFDYVAQNPQELDELFEMCLIGVTSFFRDKEAFEALERRLASIIENKSEDKSIRIWTSGCATGEEAYSIAILLHRLLKDKLPKYNIQLFATDIDEKAIAKARRGIYERGSVADMPKEILNTYFLKNGDKYELIKNIRSMVLFSRHDLTSNPPFLKLDLITCRNLLIYFGVSLQQQVMPIFHYALNQEGILFLGKSETIGQFSDLFLTLDSKNKLFQRKRGSSLSSIRFSAFKPQKILNTSLTYKNPKKEKTLPEMVKETFFQTFEHPYIIIDDSYEIIEINGDVRMFLTFPEGSMNANITKLIIPELQIEIRALISQAFKYLEVQRSKLKKLTFFGQTHYVRCTVKPLMYVLATQPLLAVVFERFEYSELFGEISNPTNSDAQQEIKMLELEQELAATKEYLQTYIQELETTNEELQSLNEEMQSTNEELQSSNEELETSNEELQSTNEEIQIAYIELKATHNELEVKDRQLSEKEAQQEALLSNTLQGFVLIDTAYKIKLFNQKAQDAFLQIFGKQLQKGSSFIDVLQADYLAYFTQDIQKVLAGETVQNERKVKSHKGRIHWLNYNYTPIKNSIGQVNSISIAIFEITELKQARLSLSKAEKLLTSVFDATNVGICITDQAGRFVNVNQEYARIYGYQMQEIIRQNFSMVLPPEMRSYAQKMHDDFIRGIPEIPMDWQVERKDGTLIDIHATAELLVQEDGTRYKVTSIRDITESKRYKKLLTDTQQEAKVGGWEYNPFIEELVLTDEVEKIFGVEAKTLLTIQNITSFFEEKDAQLLQEAFESAAQVGTPFNLILHTLHSPQKWLQVSGKPIRLHRKTIKISGTFQDITEKKDVEIALRRTLELFQETGKVARVGGWELNLDTEQLYWSEITKEIHEVSPDYVPNLKEAINFYKEGENRAKISQAVALGMEKGTPWDIDLQIITAKGREVWVRSKGQAVFENGKCVRLFGIFHDIEQQKQQSLRLLESEQRWKFALEGSGDGIWDWNLTNDEVFFSNKWKEMLGFQPDELANHLDTWRTRVHPEDIEDCYQALEKHFKRETEIYKIEHRLRGKDGTYKWILARGKVIDYNLEGKPERIISTHTDISTQKEADIKLKQNEEYLQNILDQSVDIICTATQDGKFVKVSAAAQKILGYAPQSLEGTSFYQLIHQSDLEKTRKVVIEISKGKSISTFENRYIHKEGYLVPLLWSGRWDKESQLIYAIAKDATQIIEANKQLEIYSQKITNILESINDAFFTLDADWNVTYWNRRAEEVLQMPREEMIGKNIWEVYKDSDYNAFYQQYHKAINAQKSVRFEEYSEILEKWFDVSAYPSKEGLSVYFKDITQSKLAAQALQESKNQLQTILDFAPMVVFMKDTKGNYLFMNDGYKKALNQPDLKVGMNDYQIFEKSLADKFREDDLELIKNKKTVQYEVEVNEETFYDIKFPLSNQEGEVYAVGGISLNITDTKRAEKEIRLAKERYDIVMQATNDAIWDWDIEKGEIYWGEGYKTLFGYDMWQEKISEDLWATKVHPADFEKVWNQIQVARKDPKTQKWEGEYRFMKTDGSYAYVKEKAIILRKPKEKIPYRMIGALQDITKQKEEEERLKLLESVVTHTSDAVLITEAEPLDLSGPRIVYVNDAFTKMTGYLPEEVIGKTPRILQGPKSDHATLSKLRKAQENWETFEMDLINYKKSGEEFWVNFSVVPVPDGKGWFTHWVAIERDITEQKEHEAHLTDLNNQIKRRAKELAASNAELEQFAYIASHDLQEPLRMVTSFLTQLDKKYSEQLDQKAKQYIHYAVDGAVRMRQILLDLLEYSRVGRREHKTVSIDLNKLLQEIIRINQTIVEETNAQITWEQMPTLKMSKTHAQQLFQNLISNALKYQVEGSIPTIHITAKDMKTHWQFEVKDNGIGIEEQFYEKVFVIFQRLHSRDTYSGTGIGLAICKKIVEHYQGNIWVTSEVGKGSTFYFTIRKLS